MSTRRAYSSYNDGCAAAHALDLIGERWTLIIVRELLLGPKRFADLQRDLIGVSPTVLSRRLRDLEARGIAAHRTLPAPAHVDVYELTAWGSRLEAINAALSRWAIASPAFPWDADMSPDTLVLAMRAHARRDAALSSPVRIHLVLTDSRRAASEPISYSAVVSRQDTTVEKASVPGAADAEVRSTTADWKACIIGGAPLSNLPNTTVTGSAEAVAALIRATGLRGS